MNALPFINSKDIRAHLERIGYVFSPSETAWLIYQCRGLTMRERHSAWRQLADEAPDDAPLVTTLQRQEPILIGDFLRNYIAAEENLLEQFRISDGRFVYCLRGAQDSDSSSGSFWAGERDTAFARAFFSVDACVDALKDWYQTQIADREEEKPDEIPDRYCIYCRSLGSDTPVKGGRLLLRGDGEVLGIDDVTGWENIESHGGPSPWCSFERMWFAFPAPFQKGDILYHPGTPSKYGMGGPVVLTERVPAFFARTGRQGRDHTDMTVWGCFQNENGTVYHGVTDNYMDFEYYPPEKLVGKQKILLALSNLIKGNIEPALFAGAYLHLLTAAAADELLPFSFPDEELRMAGLK